MRHKLYGRLSMFFAFLVCIGSISLIAYSLMHHKSGWMAMAVPMHLILVFFVFTGPSKVVNGYQFAVWVAGIFVLAGIASLPLVFIRTQPPLDVGQALVVGSGVLYILAFTGLDMLLRLYKSKSPDIEAVGDGGGGKRLPPARDFADYNPIPIRKDDTNRLNAPVHR